MIDDWYEKQYIPSKWSKKHPNRDAVINHFLKLLTEKGKKVREKSPSDLNVSYGEDESSRVDYFYGNAAKDRNLDTPVYVYIHGGYWQEGNKELYSAVVGEFIKRGFNSALIGYNLAPSSSISQIVLQVANGIEAICNHFNQSKLIIYGHSAGGYLAALMAKLKPEIFHSVVLISGVYDLKPLLKTSLNEALKLTEEAAGELTRDVFDYHTQVPVLVYVGDDESPESKKQSQTFHERLVENEIQSTFKVVPNEDHFSIIESLTNENSALCHDMIQLGN